MSELIYRPLLPLFLAAFLVGGCSSTPTELSVAEEEWVYEVRALQLVIKATADVNSVSGRPHSIAVGLFQMNDPNTFSGLAVTQQGAVELLQKGKIDNTIVDFQLLTVRPGEQKNISISRAHTAKYIGIVAGYYKLNPLTDVKVFPIPMQAVERGLVEKALALVALVSDEAKAIPGKLNVFVNLGRSGAKQIISIEDELLKQQQVSSDKKQVQQEDWFKSLKDAQEE
ncbi:MAG: type VI secretion system VasD/TssJ family lipoprotein [Planctomycetota bacterium]